MKIGRTTVRVVRAKHCFNRGKLPHPSAYYRQQGLSFSGGGVWKSTRCPFHSDSKPSLRVRLDSGAFRCMVCGQKGGDIVAFHQQRHRVGFITAAKQLGAWEGV